MASAKKLFAVFFCSLVCLVSPFLYGQATGSFSGTVSDNSGAVVAGAKVTVTAQATNVSREGTTDATGHYLVPLLGVGIYTVRLEAKGFKTAESRDLRLQVDEQRELDFKLVPATVSTSVEVNATEVAVETTNPTLGQVITSEQVAELPLNGRDFVQLATLTPGTTQETNPNSFFNGGASSEVSARGTFSLSVGGSRAQSTDWVLDGNDNNELTAGGIAILPSIDAIQEFKVVTYDAPAQWGTRTGPTVLVTTKQGTNRLHGSLFEFFRNTKLDATQDFASTKDQFNLNQFGGSFGGAIQKDKTFFFGDYQGTRKRRGIPFTGLIPTAAMMNGDFSLDPYGTPRGPGNRFGFTNHLVNPYSGAAFQCDSSDNPIPAGPGGVQPVGAQTCDKIPANMFDPAGHRMMMLYPQSLPSNLANGTLGINYANVPTRKLDESSFDIRLDHNFSSKDSAFARFSYDQAASFVPGGSPGFAEAGAFASTQNITNHGRNAVISETHIFSDKNINQLTFGFNRIFNHILSFGDHSCESAKLGIVNANLNSACPNAPAGATNQSTKDCISCGMTSTLMGGYWPLGDRGFAPFQGGTNVFSISDSFDMIRGKHDIKVGVGFRAHQMNVETNAFQDGFFIAQLFPGQFTGDSATDLLLGQVGGTLHDQTFLGATTGRRWKLFRPYIQDDWRATSDLTVNIGLAWAFVTPITEAQNRQADFDFATGKYLVAGPSSLISGCSICVHTDGRAGIQMDMSAVEPRIGLAWKPMGSQKTAIRAGYAIFHDSAWNQGAQGIWENPPYFAESDNFPFMTCPFGNGSSATPMACGVMQSFTGPFLFTSPVNPQNFTGTIQSQNTNFKQGRVQQFNANVEHQLPGNIVLTAGYVGSRSHHILVDGVNLNVSSPSACDPTSANFDPSYKLGCAPGGGALVAPYGPFTTVANTNDAGNAKYDSFEIKAETKSSRHGLYALLGYTYSRTYDSGFPDGLGTFPGATYWPLPGTQKVDWALSALNLDHQFTASFLYDLPFGKGKQFGANWSGAANEILGNWTVNVIERAISGFPLFVVSGNNSGVNFQWNGSSLNRPDEVGDPNKAGPVAANPTCTAPARIHTIEDWFNPCAFADAPAGKLGNANRAPVSGPRFVNTDLSLIKHFPIRESLHLDFRAEFFNLLNHPQYYLPGDPGSSGMQNSDTPSFAKMTGVVKDPRVIQFALKLVF